MGCCVSKHEEGKEGKEEDKDKDPIKSTLNSLKKKNININNTKSVTKSDLEKCKQNCLLGVAVVAVRTHPRVERRTGDDFEQQEQEQRNKNDE